MNYQETRDNEQLRFLDKSIDKFINKLRPAESRQPSFFSRWFGIQAAAGKNSLQTQQLGTAKF